MKKFRFPLDTVLDYKQQVLDSLRTEHGIILVQVRRQEDVLDAARQRYADVNAEFREKKAAGILAADARGYEGGLRVLDRGIHQEELKLEELRRTEAAKREEVVVARQETAAIEKLREHKLSDYNKEVQKSEETFIEELVSSQRVVRMARAAT